LCHTLDIQPSPRARIGARSWLSIAALLAVISLVMHAELVRNLANGVPADLGDPLLNTWILWWNAQQLPLTDAYWNAPAFAPMTRALALSETLLGLTWLTTPLQWLGASPLVAYNVLYILEPPLNGLSAYWLCMLLTSRRDASLIGALAVAFAPYHATQLSHIQTRALFFMPLALGALHRYWATGGRRWLVVLGAATALNALVCGYFLLFFSILLGIAVAWLALATRDLRKLGATLAALGIAMAAIAPVIVTFRSVRSELGLVRGLGEIERNSADLSSLVLSSTRLSVWPIHTAPDRPELATYPGIILVLVVVAGGIAASRGRVRAALRAESSWLIAWLGLASLTVIAGLTVIPRPYKVISSGIYLGAIGVLASRRFRTLVQSASMPALFTVGLVVSVALSFGPVGRVLGHRFWYKPPYNFLLNLPGFDSARVPSLFASIAVICLAVLAAFAMTRLWPSVSTASRIATALIAALIVVDGWFTVAVVPAPAPIPASLNADMVIELPAYGWVENVQAMYRGMFHGRPVVNGYSGYVPPDFARLQRDLFKDCVKNLDAYRAGHSIDAIVWKDKPGTGVTDAQLREMWPAAIREETRLAIVYRQPRSSSLPDARHVNRCQ
jgi:hypothetical protein